MIEEKRLTKIKKDNIFKKVFNFIKKFLFSKNEDKNPPKDEPRRKNNSLADEFQKSKKLLDLQRGFENGTIKEESLSEEEKKDLIELYYQQISDLDKDIQNYTRTLQFYNRKSLITQTNSENNN